MVVGIKADTRLFLVETVGAFGQRTRTGIHPDWAQCVLQLVKSHLFPQGNGAMQMNLESGVESAHESMIAVLVLRFIEALTEQAGAVLSDAHQCSNQLALVYVRGECTDFSGHFFLRHEFLQNKLGQQFQ